MKNKKTKNKTKKVQKKKMKKQIKKTIAKQNKDSLFLLSRNIVGSKIKNKKMKRAIEKMEAPKAKQTMVNDWGKGTKELKNGRTMIKITPQKTQTNAAPEAPISFGLLQREIDALLLGSNSNKQETILEKEISKKLARLLPEHESISSLAKKKHHNILVHHINEEAKHSPYVLDLSSLAEKKRHEQSHKEKIHAFLSDKSAEKREERLNNLKQELSELKRITATQLVSEKPFNAQKHPQFTKKPIIYHFDLPLHWQKSFIIFFTLCLLVVLPIKSFGYYQTLQKTKSEVLAYANTAYEDLKVATTALKNEDTTAANKSFATANYNFDKASAELAGLNIVTKTIINIIPTKSANLSDAQYLLDAGKQLSEIGTKLTPVLNSFWQGKNDKLTDKISILQTGLEQMLPQLDQIQNNINKIRPEAIPADKQAMFTEVKYYVTKLNSDLKEMNSFTYALNDILGKDYNRRYLFVFQNNNEIRPTGGFMGSLALVDIDRGQIAKMEIPGGGTYDFQGQLSVKEVSPYPLQLVKAQWQMQDANWFPDFPTSAQKIEWFYDKSGGPSVDGVIAINSSLIPKLLKIVGPIAMPEYGLTLTADNFINETQKAVQFDYDKAQNKPKQLLADMAPKLIAKLFDKNNNFVNIIQALKSGLDQRDVQMYFNNAAVQEKIKSYGWTGEIKDSSRDYLSVVNANIGGFKTDAFIKQNISLKSDVLANGDIVNTLTITRKHTGTANDLFGKESNVNFVRAYVPSGSQLLSASGFSQIPTDKFKPVDPSWTTDADLKKIEGNISIDPLTGTQVNDEFGKTVFGNWIQTDPGETQTAILQYKLPFKLSLAKSRGFWDSVMSTLRLSSNSDSHYHSLYIQKQSGEQNTSYNVLINFSQDYSVTPLFPAGDVVKTNQIAETLGDTTGDALIAFDIAKK